jgi:hypothetical protein
MKIHTNITPIDSRYHVEVAIKELSALEEEKIAQLGEPIVNAGGEFSKQLEDSDNPGSYYQVMFTLPVRHRRVPSDFPVKQIFDLVDYADADKLAKVYAQVMTERLTAAKDSLVKEKVDYIEETLVTV